MHVNADIYVVQSAMHYTGHLRVLLTSTLQQIKGWSLFRNTCNL